MELPGAGGGEREVLLVKARGVSYVGRVNLET